MSFRLRSRLLALTGLLLLVGFVTVLNSQAHQENIKYLYESSTNSFNKHWDKLTKQGSSILRQHFWLNIFDIYKHASVNVTQFDDPVHYIDKSQQKKGKKTKEVLLSKAEVLPEVQNEMKHKHELLMSEIPQKFDQSAYEPGTSGIIMVGGGKFSWLSYLGLVSIRNAGSKLPVEIILPLYSDFEQEQYYCNTTLPLLNAKCVVLPEVFGPAVSEQWGEKFGGYLLKVLAILASSFQKVLLLDSDNILVKNPDLLFNSKVFKKYGMITWPDYWERTISPIFYDISKVSVNERKRVRFGRFPLAVLEDTESNIDSKDVDEVPFHDLEGAIPNLSTESGQLMIDKSTHACTLLLSTYYNLMGPGLYYKLFSLGELGEGDKDTFPTAAVVCKQPYYHVKSFIKTFGYFDTEGSYHGTSMGQKDPSIDYEVYKKYLESWTQEKKHQIMPVKKQLEEMKSLLDKHFNIDVVPLFAVHCNLPKMDPVSLFNRHDLYDEEKKMFKYKFWGGFTYPDPKNPSQKLDFEYEQWKNIEIALCVDKHKFKFFEDDDVDNLCTLLRNQVKGLQEEES